MVRSRPAGTDWIAPARNSQTERHGPRALTSMSQAGCRRRATVGMGWRRRSPPLRASGARGQLPRLETSVYVFGGGVISRTLWKPGEIGSLRNAEPLGEQGPAASGDLGPRRSPPAGKLKVTPHCCGALGRSSLRVAKWAVGWGERGRCCAGKSSLGLSLPGPAGACKKIKNARIAAQSCRRILTFGSSGGAQGVGREAGTRLLPSTPARAPPAPSPRARLSGHCFGDFRCAAFRAPCSGLDVGARRPGHSRPPPPARTKTEAS